MMISIEKFFIFLAKYSFSPCQAKTEVYILPSFFCNKDLSLPIDYDGIKFILEERKCGYLFLNLITETL